MNLDRNNNVKYLGVSAVIAFCYPLFKSILWPEYKAKSKNKYDVRTAIVTGATGNLGREYASYLAKKQMRVIMACRDLDKCKSIRREIVLQTKHKGIVCRQLDLEDINSINKFTQEIIETEPHVDILINNAAVKEVEPKELTEYGIEKNYFINFVAPFLLTFLLMDKLKESAAITRDSRIINMIGLPKKDWSVDTSDINFDKRSYKAKEAYNQSKLALAYFTILLDKFNREEKNCVYVFGVNPGYKNILQSLYRPIGIWEEFMALVHTYTRLSSLQAVSPGLRCAMCSEFTYRRSGKLIGRLLTDQRWGVAKENETKAKLVWNNAADLLINSKTVSKKPAEKV